MTRQRARRGQTPARHGHRRVIVLVIACLVVALVVGELIDDVVKSAAPSARRGAATWTAAVAAIVAESNTLAPQLREIRAHATDAASYDRVTLVDALSLLATESAGDVDAYTSLGLGAPTGRDARLATDVLEWRAEGFSGLERGVEAALGAKGGVSEAGAQLALAGRRFVDADAAYRRLVASLGRRGDPSVLPRSDWIADVAGWSAASVGSWAHSLEGATNLVASGALRIVDLELEPPPLRTTGLPAPSTTGSSPSPPPSPPASSTGASGAGTSTSTSTTFPPPTTTLQVPPAGAVSILAATRHVRVIAVVADSGDTVVRGAHVVAVLESLHGGVVGRASVKLPSLLPGGSAYVELPKLKVARSVTYRLLVTAVLADGKGVRRSLELRIAG